MQTVFHLDRDGVINHNNRSKKEGPYYTLKPEQFIWFEGSKEAIVKLQKKGCLLHVVTSQNCISEGLCTIEDVNKIHEKMNKDIVEAGGEPLDVSTIYGVKEDAGARASAKAEAMIGFCKDYKVIDLSDCYMVGDTESDIIAGRLASCKTVHVELDYTSEQDKYVESANFHVKSLAQFVDMFLNQENPV